MGHKDGFHGVDFVAEHECFVGVLGRVLGEGGDLLWWGWLGFIFNRN